MKKIIAFLILLLCVKQSYAQYPLKQFLGSDSTLVTVRGGMNARVVLWSFTDTTQANTQRISQYAGALIYTTVLDKVWYRNSTATGWIEFTSSGGTTTNIYNSDGFITGTRVLDLSASPLTFSRSGVKQFAAEDNLTTIGSPNNQKRITVYNDSITILGLSQTTDTTTYKPLAIDGNGYFTIMDRWPGGGGSTPTLQQVLTAGSTLTGNNTITGGTYNLKFNANNIWDVDSARQWRLRSFRAADSSIQIIQSSLYGASGLKRLNISSQDTDYVSTIIIDHDHLTSEVYTRNPSTLKTGYYQDEEAFAFNNNTTQIAIIDAVNNRVGISVIIPDSTLHVEGGLKFVTGRQGAGKVLTSDANGGADWATPSGGSYTFTNGLTESGGTVKLGGDLVDDTTTIIGNNKRFQIDSTLNIILISRNASFPADARIVVSNEDGVMSRFNNGGDNSQLDVSQSISLLTDNQISLSASDSILIASDRSGIKLKGDTIKVNPGLGLLFIDTLTSAVGTKVLRYNPTTGLVSYADTTGGGGSDGYVDNATFNTTTNYLTIEQTGAADVSVRIPPSYILNTIHPDSTGFILNDSTFRLKAITVTTNNNRLTTTTTRTDSTLNFLVDIKRDTVTLASFGGGGGQAGDTTAFSTSTIYGSFYNDGTDTLVITSMRGVLQGTSPSVTYDVYYNDSLNVTAGASKLVTAGTALTNTATGAAVTSFDNTKIPPGVWVWVKTTTVTTKPTYFSLSLIGYKSRI